MFSDKIIEFVANSKRFVPHFHLPLQSGSDVILQEMQRRYRSELYRERINKIKKHMPNACIGVDVIVGFPGEDETEFNKTYTFLQELDIAYLHVFTFSERKNTPASEMSDIVPMDIRRQRNKMLTILSQKKRRKFYEQFEGSTQDILLEQSKDQERMSGFSANYLKVSLPLDRSMLNTIQKVKLINLLPEIVFTGKILIPAEKLSGN